MNEYPTPWQKKTMWGALSALAVVTIGAIAVGGIWLTSKVLGFLQPILVPFAMAGVMAYLLDPVVTRLVRWGSSRQRAVLYVFAVLSIAVAGILLWVLPAVSRQSVQLMGKLPKLSHDAGLVVTRYVKDGAKEIREKWGIQILPEFPSGEAVEPADKTQLPEALGTAPVVPAAQPKATADPVAPVPPAEADLQQLLSGGWLKTTLPAVLQNAWKFILSSVGGFLGVFGFLLSMVIVPIYLYYFLIESRNISASWGHYLPIRASQFKDEVVNTLEEINGYLIAFFRGQLLVSMINGAATGLGLVIVGVDFGLLIGLLLCVLGLIPYLGIIVCWIPAVMIAAFQGGSWLVPGSPWWVLPLVVTGIFAVVQQIDGLFITPKIVGESVGLHPMTVIVSMFVWSLLMGGLLGAILAVPMTATLKVLLKRFVWQRQFVGGMGGINATEETFSVEQASERPRGL